MPGQSAEAGDDLLLLLGEWELGIKVGNVRTRPLWQLEFSIRKPGGHPWRCGSQISKAVQQRKLIIYKILRTARYTRPDVRIPRAEAKAACAAISAGRIHRVETSAGAIKTQLDSLDKLSKQLMRDEVAVSSFEEDVFGWPKHACQAKGNPKRRRLVE